MLTFKMWQQVTFFMGPHKEGTVSMAAEQSYAVVAIAGEYTIDEQLNLFS